MVIYYRVCVVCKLGVISKYSALKKDTLDIGSVELLEYTRVDEGMFC